MNRIITLSKIAKGNAGYRFVGSASDDRVDSKGTRLSLEIFRNFQRNTAEYGNPFFDVAHYPDGRIGVCDQLWIDGHYLKVGGSFDESELAEAAIRGLLEDKNRPVRKIQQSVGFYPRAVAYEDLVLVYLSGWLEHSALTTVPVNTRTDIHLLMAAKAITKLDDASAIVGAELASLLEEKDRARYAYIEDRSLIVPDLPLGRKADAVLEALCGQLCVASPLLLFADTLPDVPAGAAEPFLLDQDVERWLEAATGRVDLTSAPIVLLSRRLIERRLGVEMSLSDGDVIELMSSRPSYAYLTRLCDLLKETVDERTWAAAHRAARGHAGGKGYPSSATAVSVAEYEAAPNSKLSELCSSESPAKLARALLAIYEANRRADIGESERHANVLAASEDFKKALLAGMSAKSGASPTGLEELTNEEIVWLHKRYHQLALLNRADSMDGMSPEKWEDAYASGTPHWAMDLAPSQLAQTFAERLKESTAGRRVLEIGVGNGRDSIYFGRAGFDVTGIDVAPSAIELAKENAIRVSGLGQKLAVNFQEGNANQLAFDEAQFAGVFSLSVLHSASLDKAIPEVARVLRSGGLFMSYVYTDTIQADGEIKPIVSVHDYINLLLSAGFRIDDFYTEMETECDDYGERHHYIVATATKI